VKKISTDLANPKNHSLSKNVALKKGNLEKKSDRGISWSKRFCILNKNQLSYFYSETDTQDMDDALGSINLKQIYNIMPLDEKKFKREHAFVIYTGSWFKKNK
jgi:hypothetical protein